MPEAPVIPAVPPAPKIVPNKPRKREQVRPVLVIEASEFGLVNNTIAREMASPSPDVEEIVDEIPLQVLGGIIKGINRGDNINEVREHAVRLASNLPDKADLIGSIIQSHEFDRLIENMKSRAYLERILHRTVRRGDLTTTEALAWHRILAEEVAKGLNLLKKSSPALDCITVIDKVDHNNRLAERNVDKKYDGTTPQGREIIRRSAYAHLKAKRVT